MITEDNIAEVLNDLTIEQIREFHNQDKDDVCIILDVFNAGFNTTLKFATFRDDFEEELNVGNIACDKDELISYFEYYVTKNWLTFKKEEL